MRQGSPEGAVTIWLALLALGGIAAWFVARALVWPWQRRPIVTGIEERRNSKMWDDEA